MFEMRFSVEGDVEEQLRRLDTAISPTGLAEFLGVKVDTYIRERAKSRFQGEGDDVVGRWSPLKDATVAIREAQGFPGAHPINKRTGDLEDYITGHRSLVVPMGDGAYMRSPGDAATGELLDKMERAQIGDSRTVARPVVGMNEQDLIAVLTMLAIHVEGDVL